MTNQVHRQRIARLQRYYFNSVEMKYQFAEYWGGVIPDDASVLFNVLDDNKGMYGYIYLSLWLGFLNVVAEGWKKLDSCLDTWFKYGAQ